MLVRTVTCLMYNMLERTIAVVIHSNHNFLTILRIFAMCTCSPSLSDLPSPILVHDELSGLSRWVNDEWVAVEPLDHDGILNTEIIRGQGIGLPCQTLISI